MLQSDPGLVALTPQSFRVQCGIPALAAELVSTLEPLGWVMDEAADLTLMIDGPWGSAMHLLQIHPACQMVLLTDNPCAEYWEDLWDFTPRALLVGGHSVPDIAKALARAQAGETFRQVPRHDSPLTTGERKLLQAAAIGLENKRIAAEQKLCLGTVKNGLNRVFEKLGLNSRTEAALYYWGLWQWLGPHPSRDRKYRRN